jgi:chemotaxis protein methyltransferase CheR
MAIVLREAGLLDRSLIYATDINPVSLAQAERGIFSTDRIRGYTENYQQSGGLTAFSDYYHVAYGNAVFDRALRRRICFAEHSLATDGVFSEVDFISCRNVLIYFNADLQARVMSIFADSLSPQGLLGLGARERCWSSAAQPAFVDFVKSARIYQRQTEFSEMENVNNFGSDRWAIR